MSTYQDTKDQFSNTITNLGKEIEKLSQEAKKVSSLENENAKLLSENNHLENEIKILKSDFLELKNIAGNISSQLDENIYTIKDILDSQLMPEIVVNINDQDYAIVCDPGEENHLKQLSSRIDFKVRELTKRFGKIGETRLMVMASLLIADEIHDLNQKLSLNLTKIEELQTSISSKERILDQQQMESQKYIESNNEKLTDLLSKLSQAS